MRIQINWNAVTAVCAIVVALFTASGWLTDGLREDIRDLRQEMREGFAKTREEFAGIRVEFAGMHLEMRKDIKDLRRAMREGFAPRRARTSRYCNRTWLTSKAKSGRIGPQMVTRSVLLRGIRPYVLTWS